jgi:hypothetical protein
MKISIVLLVSATAAQAQGWPRVNIVGGAQVADFGTEVELHEGNEAFDSTIDFEGVLGFHETASVGWAAGLWRISRRNHVEVVWNRATRDVIRSELPDDITFGEVTFDAGTEVDAFFDTWFIGASYRFAFVATPVVEFGPLIGLVAINLSTGIGISESDSGTGGDVAGGTDRREGKFTAPAILPGAFVSLRPSPRLMIHARGGYVSADFGNINGEFVQVQAGADFMLTRWIGVGGSYSYNRVSVSVDDDDFRGDVRFSFNGPQVYAVLAF